MYNFWNYVVEIITLSITEKIENNRRSVSSDLSWYCKYIKRMIDNWFCVQIFK